MQQYVVILTNKTFFQTDWYTHENCWTDNILCVVDTYTNKVTFDGKTWEESSEDHL